MAFGNASLPTRKYVYGVRDTIPGRTDDNGKPLKFVGHDLAIDQLFAANRLQNKIVEIERARRDSANRIVHTRAPNLAALLATAEALSAEVADLRAELSRRNSIARKVASDKEFAATVRARVADLKAAWRAHKTAKSAAYADPALRDELDVNDATANAAKASARNAAVAGIPATPAIGDQPARKAVLPLYWATSLIVMQRVKKSGPQPKFKRFEGEGLIAVQFQRKPDTDSPRAPVFDTNGQQKIHPRSGKPMMRHEGGSSLRTDNMTLRNSQCWIEDRGPLPRYVWVHFRIGSDDGGAPKWAIMPAVLHRPLPKGAEIKWAYLSRRKIGTHYKWEVHFDVAAAGTAWEVHDGIIDANRHPDRSPIGRGRAESGTVAVSLGWRKIDGDIRVAVWVGDDGRTGEVVIPRKRVESWVFVDELRSTRDTMFEGMKDELREWLAQRVLPPEWKNRTTSLAAWRSSARLASLVIWWRSNRLPADGAILARMEGELLNSRKGDDGKSISCRPYYSGGRRQEKHLCDFQENRRSKCAAWRKWFYRNVALELRASYRSVVIAEIDWHAIAENPQPEECDEVVNKRYRGIAACASLRDELIDVMSEVIVPSQGLTTMCHVCGSACNSPGRGRWVQCERCGGKRMDRAFNHAKNLLNRNLQGNLVASPARVS